jgi:hypothetical protein
MTMVHLVDDKAEADGNQAAARFFEATQAATLPGKKDDWVLIVKGST